MQRSLKICFSTSELAPFAKTGGLADVASALPAELHRTGHDVRLFLPLYSRIDSERWDFRPVEFIRDVTVPMGGRSYTFSARTAALAGQDLPFYLIDCPELYHRAGFYTEDADEGQRFAFFSRAVIECCQRMGWAPDVFHCNDWHAALIPMLLRSSYEWDSLFHASKTLVTIHNIGYQGVFGSALIETLGLGDWSHMFDQEDLRAGRLNFLRTGLIYADAVSTVSPTHAREIQTDEYGMGLQELLRARRDTLFGILNGVDYGEWDPRSDPWIPYHYRAENLQGKRRNKLYLLAQLGLPAEVGPPLLGLISRLVPQKGLDLAFDVLPRALSHGALRLAVLGSGEERYERFFLELQGRFPDRVCFYRGHSNELAHLIEAGSDIYLMPSRYEPCGLNQMFSMRYGTLPVVRRTGGLADSVKSHLAADRRGTGFVFDHYTAEGLEWALSQAIKLYGDRDAWLRLIRNAMAEDFSWATQAGRYVRLYRWLIGS